MFEQKGYSAYLFSGSEASLLFATFARLLTKRIFEHHATTDVSSLQDAPVAGIAIKETKICLYVSTSLSSHFLILVARPVP